MDAFNSIQPGLFSSLQNQTLTCHKRIESVRVRDIDFVISQRKLDKLDPSQLSKFLEPLSSSSSSENYSLSDEQLFEYCKSRYVQQPSDVADYAQYLLNKAEEIKSQDASNEERKKQWASFLSRFKSENSNNSNNSNSD